MPKLKTKKGVAKRFRCTGKNKVKRDHACKGHLKQAKNAKRKRKLSRPTGVTVTAEKMIKALMPYC
ncbi:MAG: 50S ribosomal protein L35 [Candidatus Omnitrophica bacterium]|nr:50S ribosomal protein L35 [Candidatus Omnitrophota bacterium]